MVYQPFNPYRVQGLMGRAPRFKPAGKKPVKGGRWSVRQKLDGKYRAWCQGHAAQWGANFLTWEYAVKWAHYVANAYAIAAEEKQPVSAIVLRAKRKQYRELDRVRFESRPRRINMKAYPYPRQKRP
jgi:hypothetical protein